MDIKISNIKERILYFAKNQNISYESFCESIGMTYGSFKGVAKKRPLNSDALEILITKYPEINCEWLLSGKGAMLKENSITVVSNEDAIFAIYNEKIDALEKKISAIYKNTEKINAEYTLQMIEEIHHLTVSRAINDIIIENDAKNINDEIKK